MSPRPRLEDVASRVGVSTASVSLVLRGAPGPSAETRRRVLEAAAEMGYRADRAASMLARRRKHLLGLMLDVRNPFHAELAEEIQIEADDFGYEVVLSTRTRKHDEERTIAALLDFRCEALLLLGPDASDESLGRLAAQVPLVSVGRRVGQPGVDEVRTSDNAGVEAALQHLISLGHERIAFVDGGRGPVESARPTGYRQAVKRAGLSPLVFRGDHTEAGGMRAAGQLLAAPELPTAVMASNDSCAVGLMDVLARTGRRVPGEISVVGYDDSTLARLAHIDLTTVSQDAPAQARHAVMLAVQRLDEGRESSMDIVLNPRLVVRGTTGPPP